MAELDEKLVAMMADPNIMAQVAAMAKSLGMAPPVPAKRRRRDRRSRRKGRTARSPRPRDRKSPLHPHPRRMFCSGWPLWLARAPWTRTAEDYCTPCGPTSGRNGWPGWKTPCGPPSWPEPPRPCWREEAMYNRYVPQGDGTYRRMDGAPKPPAPPPAPPGPPGPPLPPPDRPPRPPMGPPGPLGDLLSRWLPSGMDREDLLILLLILATSPDDSTAGLTVALYFALA